MLFTDIIQSIGRTPMVELRHLDAGGARLFDSILNQRFVDDGKHLLGDRLGGRQKAGAQAGDREDGFAQFLDHVSTPV